jgi:hypothetical protein
MKLRDTAEWLFALLWITTTLFIIMPLSEAAFMLRAMLANKRRNSSIHHKITLQVLVFLLTAMALFMMVKA